MSLKPVLLSMWKKWWKWPNDDIQTDQTDVKVQMIPTD